MPPVSGSKRKDIITPVKWTPHLSAYGLQGMLFRRKSVPAWRRRDQSGIFAPEHLSYHENVLEILRTASGLL